MKLPNAAVRILPLAAMLLLPARANAQAAKPQPSVVSIGQAGSRYTYLVNGKESMLIGMGYNPIYRTMANNMRAAAYRRDFKLLCQAGVNTITGWDSDKGFEQDRFDEVTLDAANQYGIGVVMPIFMPAERDYTDPGLIGYVLQEATAKVTRFKDHPALRMWGVGNEVLTVMPPEQHASFLQVYLNIIDLVHQLDPNHPVIYREAEDEFVPELVQLLQDSGNARPWWLYGMNIYDKDPAPQLRNWPVLGMNRPLFVSEFGYEGSSPAERAQGYVNMWRTIRAFPEYVLGAAPYVWSAAGPEPTDAKWGLMRADSVPVDDTFGKLAQEWRLEPKANGPNCG
jgi:hypothetical protein